MTKKFISAAILLALYYFLSYQLNISTVQAAGSCGQYCDVNNSCAPGMQCITKDGKNVNSCALPGGAPCPGRCLEVRGSRRCPYNDACCYSNYQYPPRRSTPIPTGSSTDTNITPPDKSRTITPQITPAVTIIPPAFVCEMCDRDADGVITQVDIDKISKDDRDPLSGQLSQFCTQNCLGKVIRPSLQPSIPAGDKSLGDCASVSGPGIKDGITDLFDVEEFRKEISGDSTALHCDYNKSGSVDLFDFKDYVEPGFIAMN